MRFALIAALAAALMSCSGVKDAATSSDEPGCATVVEGMYRAQTTFEGKVPALAFKQVRGETRVIRGRVLSVTDAGILFDQDRDGPFHDPDPKLYPLDQVACAIDSAQNVVYGAIPREKALAWDLDIVFRRTDDTTAQPLKFQLRPGEAFSFCIPPGTYAAKEMYFSHDQDVAAGEFIPAFTFTAAPQSANYIGELRLDLDSADAPGVCVIPFKVIQTGSTGWGGMFGLAGGLVEALTTDYGIQGGHRLKILSGGEHKSGTALPVVSPVVTFAPHPMMPAVKDRK